MDTELDSHSAPSEASSGDTEYRQARERAEMIQGLYVHLLVFSVINVGLLAINWLTRGDDGSWWFQWPLLIWGIALAIHLLVTVAPVFSSGWVERRVQRTLTRHNGR